MTTNELKFLFDKSMHDCSMYALVLLHLRDVSSYQYAVLVRILFSN